MISYRREIDGLRALAVLPVILFHAGLDTFSGGFVGVDVFFVVSGYLITSIILSEKEAGAFSLINFYERRARRILPALFLVIGVCMPFAWILLDQFDLISFSRSAISAVLFFSNFFFWRDGGYFEIAAELKPLLHTWSLAVEEQYYMFFPLFLMLIWRVAKQWMVGVLLFVALSSLALAQWAAYNMPSAAFFLLPTRGWEIAIGALIALYFAKQNRTDLSHSVNQSVSAAGLLLICIAIFVFEENTPFPGLYALVPTIGAALIILFATPTTLVGRVLSTRGFVGVGLISYSAYLWHQPLLAFTRHYAGTLSPLLALAVVSLVFALAYLSWKYVETPFRDKRVFSHGRFISVIIITSLLLIGLGALPSIVFSSSSTKEAEVAKSLVGRSVVFASSMDERQFIKYRILYETIKPDAIIIGSSRVMQIGNHILDGPVLNLAVSGATIEDDIALFDLAYQKFSPKTVFIGADPWLFNSESGQNRWHSLNKEYEIATARMSGTNNLPIIEKSSNDEDRPMVRFIQHLYRMVNVSSQRFPVNDSPELRAKIRSDGSRVYDITYANKSPAEILRGIETLLNYSMRKYQYDEKLKNVFRRFVEFYKDKVEIVLVLSPYHPHLYELMRNDRQIFLNIETDYLDFARDAGIKIVGSYNPEKVGCSAEEFFDGMHPKDACMEKVLRALNFE